MRWSTGERLPHALYLDGTCIGVVDNAALAREIVARMNEVEDDPTIPPPVASDTFTYFQDDIEGE